MDKVVLKRTSRILAGHPWIFSNELSASPKQYAPGSIVEVYDNRNTFLGRGYINPQSLIAVRLLTRLREEIGPDFFRRRMTDAMEYRRRFLPDIESCRVIYSEGDFLPGLIVDKYAGCLAVQFNTLGMDALSDMILELLDDIYSPSTIIVRNDGHSRTLEGLSLEKRVIKGNLDALPVIREGNISLEINPMSGQKTGFFLDQRENRMALSSCISGGSGLDLFCYTGAWGLQLARNGASVTFVDDSETVIRQAAKNAAMNGLESRCEFIKGNVFDFLKKHEGDAGKFDFVVLDPPAFVKSRTKIKEAVRAYREINASAMRLVRKGGILATSSCSYHIEREVFLDMLRSAAKGFDGDINILELRSQAKDHPVLLSVPETEYLKCALLKL